MKTGNRSTDTHDDDHSLLDGYWEEGDRTYHHPAPITNIYALHDPTSTATNHSPQHHAPERPSTPVSYSGAHLPSDDRSSEHHHPDMLLCRCLS